MFFEDGTEEVHHDGSDAAAMPADDTTAPAADGADAGESHEEMAS